MKKPRQRGQRNYSQEYEKSLENYGMYNNIWLWVTMKCNNKNANTEQKLQLYRQQGESDEKINAAFILIYMTQELYPLYE